MNGGPACCPEVTAPAGPCKSKPAVSRAPTLAAPIQCIVDRRFTKTNTKSIHPAIGRSRVGHRLLFLTQLVGRVSSALLSQWGGADGGWRVTVRDADERAKERIMCQPMVDDSDSRMACCGGFLDSFNPSILCTHTHSFRPPSRASSVLLLLLVLLVPLPPLLRQPSPPRRQLPAPIPLPIAVSTTTLAALDLVHGQHLVRHGQHRRAPAAPSNPHLDGAVRGRGRAGGGGQFLLLLLRVRDPVVLGVACASRYEVD